MLPTTRSLGISRALAMAVALLGVLPGISPAQQWPLPPAPKAARVQRAEPAVPEPLAKLVQRLRLASAPLAIPHVTFAARAVVEEGEPNDSAQLATPVTFGDTVTGVINPTGDFDFFAFDLDAGTVVDLDVDAQVLDSQLDSYLILFNEDTSWVAYNDDYDGLDSRLIATIPSTGRWYVLILDWNYGGGTGYTYRLSLGEFAVDEVEPNDTPVIATAVTFGDTVIGAIASGDVDYFAVDISAATYARVAYVPILTWTSIEITLYGTDGTTPLAVDTSGSYAGDQLRHWITAQGRYYVAVRPLWGSAGLYGLQVHAVPIGPGDPTTAVASGFGSPGWAVMGTAGQVYVWDHQWARLLRVSPAGAVSVLAESFFPNSPGMAVDGFGDLLVGSYGTSPMITRYRDDGTTSVFADSTGYVYALTVGPDGDVWALTCGATCPGLERFDVQGRRKSTTAVTSFGHAMAFAPSGKLYVLDGSRVLALTPGQSAATVIEDYDRYFLSLAFDQDGYLYLGTDRGEIRLYGPSHTLVAAPFAVTHLGLPFVMFARDAAGAMTSRLLAVNSGYDYNTPFAGTMVQANPDGVRAPGHPAQPRLLRLATAVVRAGVMGAAYADTLRVLDAVSPITWQVTEGTLPAGLTLATATGVLSGTPTASGTFSFRVRAEGGGRFGLGSLTIRIGEPQLAVTDVVNALLGIPGLMDAEQERFLDLQGNNNGHLDIGDVRAFLRSRGQLPASVAAPVLGRKEER